MQTNASIILKLSVTIIYQNFNKMCKQITSENANLSATSLVHSNNRVSWRVNLRIETGTVVTFASCPASLSHNVITYKSNKEWFA